MQLKHLFFAAFAGAAAAQGMNLTALLAGNNQTTALAGLLGQYPELAAALGSASNVTLLAPANSALSTLLNSSAGAALAADPGLTQAVLQYHVLNGTYDSSAITNRSTFIPTLLTNTSYTNVTGGQRVDAIAVGSNATFFSGLLANVSVVQANLTFSGGVVHVIDGVLTLPQNVTATALALRLTSLAGALSRADLLTVNNLQDITVLAPSNEAFQSIGSALSNLSTSDLASILSYHVVNGTVGYSTMLTDGMSLPTVKGGNLTVRIINGTTFINDAKVVTPDVLVANGVVHVIDNVLNPNNTSSAPASTATAGAPAFSGASSVSEAPFTSGLPTPTATVSNTGGAPGAASSAATSSGGAAMPMRTGAIGAAALFGAGAAIINY